MKFTPHEIFEYLLIGATSGIFAASVVICARLATDPGDILGFVGGAFGAGAAVVGALWLERKRIHDGQIAARTALRDALLLLAGNSKLLGADFDLGFKGRLLSILQGAMLCRELIKGFSYNNVRVMANLSTLDYWLESDIERVKEAVKDEKAPFSKGSKYRNALLYDLQTTARIMRPVFAMPGYWPSVDGKETAVMLEQYVVAE